MKTSIKFLVCIGLLVGLNSVQAQRNSSPLANNIIGNTEPTRNIIESNYNTCELEYTFNGYSTTEKRVNSKTYHYVHINGFGKMSELGKPALPSHTEMIAIPKGSKVGIKIISADYQDITGYMVHPALKPASDEVGAPEPRFEINDKQYKTNAFYPSEIVESSETYILRGLPVALVNIRPVQFNPVTKTLRVYSKIRYKISFKGQDGKLNNFIVSSSPQFLSYARNIVLNNNLIETKGSGAKLKSGSTDYIIITHPDYKNAADTLAKWKMQLGYDVVIIEKTNWTSAQIKDTVSARYYSGSPAPDYVVFLGDVDKVPGEIISSSFSCDLYYVCMDGAGDYFADMAGGRISVNSSAEALMVVQKMVNYERNPVTDTSFYDIGLNCTQFQDYDSDNYADRRFSLTSENVYDYMTTSQGFNVSRVYVTGVNDDPQFWNNGYYAGGEPLPSYLLKPGFLWDGDAADIINEINAGKLFVLHRDHGYTGGWGDPAFSISDIPNLNNGAKLPVMFSINCSSGDFGSTSFAEKMLQKDNGGAVGVVAASDISYSGYNDAMAIGFFDGIWSNPGIAPNFTGSGWIPNPSVTPHTDIHNMGFVLMQGLVRMSETWGGFQTSHELFHYHGDPAMKIWTSVPAGISASHPTSVACNTSSLTITSCSYTDGLATLYHNGKLIGSTQLSGGAGNISFDPITNIIPYATLTISGDNYSPYIAEIAITNCAIPPTANFVSSDTSVVFCGSSSETVTILDASIYGPDTWTWTVTPSNVIYVNGTNQNSQHPQMQFTIPGIYTISLLVTNSYGSDALTATDIITVSSGKIIPFAEDFESVSFPPEGWSINNPDMGITWGRNTNAVGKGNSAASASINYYSYPDMGERDEMISPIIDLVNEPDASLHFDLAYAQFSNYIDTLAVYVSTDCGVSYDPNPIYLKYGNMLETVPSSGGSFVPGSATDWRNEAGDLSPYIGNQVVLKFVGTSGYGNNLYIDNINVFSSNTLPLVDFMASDTSISCNGTADTISFLDLSLYDPSSWTWSFSPGTVSFLNGTNANSQNPQVKFNDYGSYTVMLITANNAGNEFHAKADYILIEEPSVAPFTEAFENQLIPPNDWQLVNPDNDKTWDLSLTATGNGASIASAYLYNYAYYAPGEIDELISPTIDLNGAASANLTFNIAYRIYSTAYEDSFKVFVSTDCGASFHPNPIYANGGITLQTSSGSASSFTPSQPSDWRNEFIDLSSYVGGNIILKFQAINDYGNNLFLDDINISVPGTFPSADFSTSLTSMYSCEGTSQVIDLYESCANNPSSWDWQIAPGSFTYVNGTNEFSENPQVRFLALGAYTVQLKASNSFGADSVTKSIIIDSVDAAFTMSNDTLFTGLVYDFTNASFGESTWYWDFGDGMFSNQENPIHAYADTGHYNISQFVENTLTGCSDSAIKEVFVAPYPGTGMSLIDGQIFIKIAPIPSDGVFDINYSYPFNSSGIINIYNIVGQKIYSSPFETKKHGIHHIDLSENPKGIYYVHISTTPSAGLANSETSKSFIIVIK